MLAVGQPRSQNVLEVLSLRGGVRVNIPTKLRIGAFESLHRDLIFLYRDTLQLLSLLSVKCRGQRIIFFCSRILRISILMGEIWLLLNIEVCSGSNYGIIIWTSIFRVNATSIDLIENYVSIGSVNRGDWDCSYVGSQRLVILKLWSEPCDWGNELIPFWAWGIHIRKSL